MILIFLPISNKLISICQKTVFFMIIRNTDNDTNRNYKILLILDQYYWPINIILTMFPFSTS